MPYRGSAAEIQAVARYQAKRDTITIRPTNEDGAEIRRAAAAAGKSVQAYILDVLRDARTSSNNR